MLHKVCNQLVMVKPLSVTAASQALRERRIIPVNTSEFRYLRFRAIGNMEWKTAGPNGNWDGFPYEYFEDERPGYGYQSFINKRAHVEHNSAKGLAGSIGDLPDAYLNRFSYGDAGIKCWADLGSKEHSAKRKSLLLLPNQKDGSIEVLMRIDTKLVKSAEIESKTKHLLERIIRMIDTGQALTCSMGANIEYSVCSTCGNLAHFSNEYCEHLKPTRKGGMTIVPANQIRDLLDKEALREEWLWHTVVARGDIDDILKGISNRGIAVRNAELNHVVSFFELSVVATPAYPDAKMLEKLARKQDESQKEYLRRIVAEMGPDMVIDLYSVLQEQGLISSQCEVN